MKRVVGGLSLVGLVGTLAVLVGTGCVAEATTTPVYEPAAYGDIILTWSINGDASGIQCAPHGAALVEVKITDPQGGLVDDWQMDCTGEGTDETLAFGAYTASAQLEDVNGDPITTAASAPFQISAGYSSAPIDFDFSESSFTNGT